jgi:catechol 2,3-dioxygenase-like lactoylglutathione lyase family enzyme
MSYVALATNAFDAVTKFYGHDLGFPVVEEWDRPTGRGRRFDLLGLRLEILDNARERHPLRLGTPADRVHLVIEVSDLDAASDSFRIGAPPPHVVSWGARLFEVRDPDGVAVTFLEWLDKSRQSA